MEQVNDPVEKEKAWEDLGRPEEPKVAFAYTVIVGTDGSVTTQVAEPSETVSRKANSFDIYTTCKDIAHDIDSQILADRVSKTVLANLRPQDSAKDLRERLMSALSDRGIETPKP